MVQPIKRFSTMIARIMNQLIPEQLQIPLGTLKFDLSSWSNAASVRLDGSRIAQLRMSVYNDHSRQISAQPVQEELKVNHLKYL